MNNERTTKAHTPCGFQRVSIVSAFCYFYVGG
jgi:hypothetical protein